MENQNIEYSSVIDTITSMFGDLITRDVICAVVESYEGDLNLSVEAVMNITSDTKNLPNNQAVVKLPQMVEPNKPSSSNNTLNVSNDSQTSVERPTTSYASTAQSRGAIPKQLPKPKTSTHKANFWTDQIRQIMAFHTQGARILIILRGAPGSGKTFLAKQIVETFIGSTYRDYSSHIYSTDDFFMVRGQYQYDKNRISEAHTWNRYRVREVLQNGLSPVIIDNTNIELWEMESYVRDGVANGYYIEVVEPITNWAKKAFQLFRRNTHNVPLVTIKRMLENYQNNITGVKLIEAFKLSYPSGMNPPVLRKIPPVLNLGSPDTDNKSAKDKKDIKLQKDSSCDSQDECTVLQIKETFNVSEGITEASPEPISIHENSCNNGQNCPDNALSQEIKLGVQELSPSKQVENDSELSCEEITKQNFVIEAQKRLTEIEQFEAEWENGETWDDDTKSNYTANSSTKVSPLNSQPKPPRKQNDSEPAISVNLMDSVNKCDDWSQIAMFMPPWHDNPQPGPSTSAVVDEAINVEKISCSTCVESGDTDVVNNKNNYKIIYATPRDINAFHLSFNIEKIPDRRKLDKGTLTYESVIADAYRCKNEEQHFIAFRKMFKNVGRADLRDIFDKCRGDVNWAVDIVLDSMTNKLLETVESDDLSDAEEEIVDQCNCLAEYNIIPGGTSATAQPDRKEDVQETANDNGTQFQKKSKKDIVLSESSMELKRQIEQNVVISENHYSAFCLKLKKMRHGETSKAEDSTEPQENAEGLELTRYVGSSAATTASVDNSDDEEESNAECVEEPSKVMNVNVGMEFISMLDEMFGRKDMTYPNSVKPILSISNSVLNELNAAWMESVMNQLENETTQIQDIIKQDEEFARELALKEAELLSAGKEPAIPDFKEIMDLDFAISLYQKDLAEWRNSEPQDLAARMTRDKLYNLFPEVSQDTLAELLMAHDNNFQCTVESLLVSTGRQDILAIQNGVNKFVVEKEMLRQEKLLEEQRQALAEEEWPLLPKGETATMENVISYRNQGEKHLQRRNLNYQKAQEFIRRGMTQVATHYSTIASYHKQRYEQANSLAAAALIQVHAQNNPDSSTIDLHYMRVAEAKESLDIFLDGHIRRLKENRSGPRYQTLFFITGRGLHSNGIPRIKPAVKKRLRERGLNFSERNPGLLTSKVCCDDKLAYEVPTP